MHELVVRDATVIDGTGGDRRVADVAGDAGIINADSNGAEVGSGRREINAAGL